MNSTSLQSIPQGLVLHPTMQEFSNFAEYWEKLEREKKLEGYGLVKVVPPKKWKATARPIEEALDGIMVNSPIEQNLFGKGGIYELMLIQKKSMSVRDYRKKVEYFDSITDKKTPDEVEELFWKNISFSPPLYGADMRGSLFDKGVKWNLRELNGVLADGLTKIIDGVNDPYLYVGSWKTMFGWHKEDIDLYSINFLHYGKPKFWYCMPPSEGPKLEAFARHQFPEYFARCKEYLRHKNIMISPQVLLQHIPDLKIHKIIHHPGEFVITLGGSYHAGFNWGFNVAEAVNFATPAWLDIFPAAKSCLCIKDSVKIDPVFFYTNLAQSRYKDHPTVQKYLAEYHIEIKNQTKKDQMEVEKTSKPVLRSSLNYSSTISVKSDERSDSDSTGDASPKRSMRSQPKGDKKKQKEVQTVKKVSASKKISKSAIRVTRGKKTKHDSDVESTTDDRKQLNKMLKEKKPIKGYFVENWIQCEKCSKWRKITKRNVWDKVKDKKSVSCKDVPNLTCKMREEDWEKTYITIPEKYGVKAKGY